VVQERWVEDGKFITSGGVSAGIDMALYLVSKLTDQGTARRVQLALDYDPQPRSAASTGRTFRCCLGSSDAQSASLRRSLPRSQTDLSGTRGSYPLAPTSSPVS
jgi:transcriptional regulator GlxA family with amidase domain